IFTRAGNCESGSSKQSSFSSDLKQVSRMISLATSRSLCVVDEFGKGTLVADGVGLLCSTLGFMAAQPIPPKLLVCTHFSEIMNQNLLNPSAQITFCTMAILEQPETVEGSNEITFLYRLKPGRNLDSHGIHCARLAGLPPAVLERSREIQSKIQAGIPVERLSNARTSGRDKCYK
ncbi:unnamed protein product, partial [Closterium sp. Naga37s-1]